MNDNEDALAKCPFYKSFRGTDIQCESRVRRTRLLFSFGDKSVAMNHKRIFCDTYGWCNCNYARLLLKVYEEGLSCEPG